jgi:hypothetical protein
MEKEYLIIDNHVGKNGDITEFKECDGKILIKQFSGLNTDNFIIKKFNGKRLEFSFFKLNGVYYININGCHIIDYKHFINIQHISKDDKDEKNVKIKNRSIGDMILIDCDVDIVHKALTVMSDWMKSKQNTFSDFMYYIFH